MMMPDAEVHSSISIKPSGDVLYNKGYVLILRDVTPYKDYLDWWFFTLNGLSDLSSLACLFAFIFRAVEYEFKDFQYTTERKYWHIGI